MQILILCRFADTRAQEFSQKLSMDLKNLGHVVQMCDEDLSESHVLLYSSDNPPDIIVVVGGDGTILLALDRKSVV